MTYFLLNSMIIPQAEYVFMNTFTKITCNSSGKTCVDPFCYIKTDNQSLTYLTYGCTIKKEMKDANVSLNHKDL